MQVRLITFILIFTIAVINLIGLSKMALALEVVESNRVGKILFTNKLKSFEDYQESDFVSKIDFHNNKNLYFAGFLQQPLSKSIAAIMPDLPNAKGNYQFSFLVNGKLIYTENLNMGAGTAKQKSQDVVLFKPFYSETNEDSWGRFLWMRFMHFGGEEALVEGLHKLQIEIRPYVKLSEIKIGNILLQGELAINVVKPHVSKQQMAVQKIQPDSGWKIAQQDFNHEKIEQLNTRILQKDFKQITSVVVIKQGKLLFEEYFNGATRNTLHDPRSVGKSFASTMLGIAIEDGHIKNIEQPLSDFYNIKNFANFSAQKSQVSLKDLLTMSSGFAGNDNDYDTPGNEENMYPTDDWVKFTLDLPMAKDSKNTVPNSELKASENWQYFTAGVVLLGDIIHQSVPKGLEYYADQKLFAPLGIENYKWQYTPQQVANTAGGLQLRALDFAKYGQLYQNQGRWNGKQVIPAKWVEASLAKQAQRDKESNQGHYGFLFWNDHLELNNKSYEVAYATGNGGNKIFIFKDIPYVIVITATAYNQRYAHPQVNQMMQNYIMPAILGY